MDMLQIPKEMNEDPICGWIRTLDQAHLYPLKLHQEDLLSTAVSLLRDPRRFNSYLIYFPLNSGIAKVLRAFSIDRIALQKLRPDASRKKFAPTFGKVPSKTLPWLGAFFSC